MAFSITHAFQSLKSDGIDVSFVQPSNWNAAHVVNMDAYTVVGRGTGAGAGSGIPWSYLMPPLGCVLPYAPSTLPDASWLFCYGQPVSRVTYLDLFTLIGTTYGVGDGATTFNLPDLRGRIPVGKDDMGGAAASRITSTTMSPNGTTLGATGGSQTETASVSVSGTVNVSGTTAGSLSVTVTGVTDGPNLGSNARAGLGQLMAHEGHAHVFTGTGTTSGSLIVWSNGGNSMTGSTAAATNVQPSMIMNYIIKALQSP